MVCTTPPPGSHKLNVDVSIIDRSKNAIIVGVIRDDNGMIEKAFARSTSDVTFLVTEVWSLRCKK